MAASGTVIFKILGDSNSLSSALATAKTKLAGLKSQSTLTGAAVAAGAVVVGAAMIKMGAASIQAFVKAASAAKDFQRVTGASAEDSSKWVAAAQRMGISSEAVAKGMFKLARGVGEGGTKLAQYGIQVARTKDGNVDMSETLLNVSDAYRRTKDAGTKAAIVMAAFGRAGAQMIPILAKGRGELEDFFKVAKQQGLIFDQKQLDSAVAFKRATRDLGAEMNKFKIEIGSVIIGPVTDLITGLIEIKHRTQDLANAVPGGLAGKIMGGAVRAPFAAATMGLSEFAVKVGHAKNESSELGKAQEVVARTQKFVNDAIANGNTDTPEYAANLRDLKTATGVVEAADRDLADVQNEVADATKRTREAVQGLLNTYLGVVGADLNREQALLSQKKATDEVTAATWAVAAAEKQFGKSSMQAAVARDDLTDKQLAARQADLNVVQSGMALDASLKKLKQAARDGSISQGDLNRQLDAFVRKHPEMVGAVDRIRVGARDMAWQVGKAQGPWNVKVGSQGLGETNDLVGRLLGSLSWGSSRVWSFSIFGKKIGFAEGGPVGANSPIIVGEKGPEMFLPKSAGQIIPNHKMGSGRAGGGGTVINIYPSPFTNARETGKELIRLIRQAELSSGKAWRS